MTSPYLEIFGLRDPNQAKSSYKMSAKVKDQYMCYYYGPTTNFKNQYEAPIRNQYTQQWRTPIPPHVNGPIYQNNNKQWTTPTQQPMISPIHHHNNRLYPIPTLRPVIGPIIKCRRCNYSHPINKCPALGERCYNCGKINHFSSVCRSNKQ